MFTSAVAFLRRKKSAAFHHSRNQANVVVHQVHDGHGVRENLMICSVCHLV